MRNAEHWMDIVRLLAARRPHEEIVIPKGAVAHPRSAGFVKGLGEPKGQLADYELTLQDGGRIHVREYEDRYEVHRDLVSPRVDWVGHLRADAPHWYMVLGAMLSASIAIIIGRKPREIALASAIGAAGGFLVSLLSGAEEE
mgnify:FL=1